MTGDIIWPRDADGTTPSPVPPHGIVHHYAPLAWIGTGTPVNLRREFDAAARCHVTDG